MTTNDQPQTIPADKVRDLRDQYARLIEDAGTKETQAYYGHVVKDLDALLPPPPLPTLADMTEEERRACKWMQADVEGIGRGVIIDPLWTGRLGRVIWPGGDTDSAAAERITPRPDLPRMEWPSADPEAEDANTVKAGTVIESADDPRLAALPVGSILGDRDGGPFDITKTDTGNWAGPGYVPAQGTGTKWGPWTVRRIGKEGDQ